jgi:hypothetical protein
VFAIFPRLRVVVKRVVGLTQSDSWCCEEYVVQDVYQLCTGNGALGTSVDFGLETSVYT